MLKQRSVPDARVSDKKTGKDHGVSLLPLRFFMAEVGERSREQYRLPVCLTLVLFIKHPRRITVGIQRCEAIKFVAFCRSSAVGLILPSRAQTSRSVRFRSDFESPLLDPPWSIRCCFCSLTAKCFPCPVRSRRGGVEDQEAQKAQLTLPQ